MSEPHAPGLAHQFESHEQQHATGTLGMWAFLAQEVMFFGGLFTVYLVYRHQYFRSFVEGSAELDAFLGTLNTGVLILSSLTMALAVRAAQLGNRRQIALFIGVTMVLACVFLGVKVEEYTTKWEHGLVPGLSWHPHDATDPHAPIFFGLYFVMTGVHALHMIVGLGIMVVVAVKALRGRYGPTNHHGVEVHGLYWHFVDLIWIFLFPLLYLLGRHEVHP
jgi:cytochrome c oxidase subunit 3